MLTWNCPLIYLGLAEGEITSCSLPPKEGMWLKNYKAGKKNKILTLSPNYTKPNSKTSEKEIKFSKLCDLKLNPES